MHWKRELFYSLSIQSTNRNLIESNFQRTDRYTEEYERVEWNLLYTNLFCGPHFFMAIEKWNPALFHSFLIDYNIKRVNRVKDQWSIQEAKEKRSGEAKSSGNVFWLLSSKEKVVRHVVKNEHKQNEKSWRNNEFSYFGCSQWIVIVNSHLATPQY